MTPHRKWFYEYEKYDGGDVLLRDESPTNIVRRAKLQLLLRDGRRRTLLGVLHIPRLERNIISINRMSDVGVHTIFEKDSCKMVHGAMVVMRGAHVGMLTRHPLV